MPNAKNPNAKEFFVYQFETRGIPFYVGIGRDKRALDRVRYVRYMKKREASGKRVKWCLSSRVIAGLCGRGEEVHLRLVHRKLPRAQALLLEKRRIIRLVFGAFEKLPHLARHK